MERNMAHNRPQAKPRLRLASAKAIAGPMLQDKDK